MVTLPCDRSPHAEMVPRSLSNSTDGVADGLKEAKIENDESEEEERDTTNPDHKFKMESLDEKSARPLDLKVDDESESTATKEARSPVLGARDGEKILSSEIKVKKEPGEPLKLARTPSQKIQARATPLFGHLPDVTAEATSTFQLIKDCVYTPKYLGDTEHAMECDCAEEWDPETRRNLACGDDSDCINRATKMECYGDCGCGVDCENQRFQRRQYANVTVIKTEKKGHGLRTEAALRPGDFIFEYIGEVINENQFRKRMIQYDEEGIKHFYFMSLNRGEFVDATKRGNLGRFCNHSCNPNCYVDKWVIGSKLRMGIFAERFISAGEELVFNYNVDRYGADPQPCYCGEPNCTGFIGGKTQTERATKLSQVTIEALGIDDGDGWDTAVAKRPRKKKTGEDDEEYVNNVQPRSLDEEGVTKVMASLLQNKEKWITVKLLSRIEQCEEERIINRVVKMHGYQILKSVLASWKDDVNVVIQVFNVLDKFPRLTKNKITDSKIEETIEELRNYDDEQVENRAGNLLQAWSTLETAYRIPRKKRDPNTQSESHPREQKNDNRRRSRSRSKSSSPSRSPPRGPAIPSGPRGGPTQRGYFHGNRPPFRPARPLGSLPEGWFQAISNGRTYYYTSSGHTQWARPTAPASKPAPPPPPKPTPANKALDDIINEITSAKTKAPENTPANTSPNAVAEAPPTERRKNKEKWKQYSEDKQKKIYENTLFPHVKAVVDQYKHDLPKDDCKRFFKEVCKKFVNSDFKNNRVQDPYHITEKQAKNVKKFTKEFFDKAVTKKKAYDLKREQKKAAQAQVGTARSSGYGEEAKRDDESDVELVDATDEDEPLKDNTTKSATPATPMEQIGSEDTHKRKRGDEANEGGDDDDPNTPSKRANFTPPTPPPPPPPPPPLPVENLEDDQKMFAPNNDTVFVHQAPADSLKSGREPQPIRSIHPEASATEFFVEHRAVEIGDEDSS